ncbi:UDP-N-acetylmuramoyl-tripeptide--D-alanyl-D-alanine ligase [Lentisphaera profundi]|uniref:UDP-N-acetylmuramoyl-tripeptide--D-alanyl-D-alanine ligase n=1 Tax=Lentisphaera profundi TaxID=1658616 RepID=A0ABY7VNH5_9BACT|nr:UDP-N-acetylmuramoyl-tripeptide--D-alanyl-D-alanine ligase [Lentisphaera profundi]WDE95675.1 UDP-N-acetylmuramoyl-tripeptide--D-alanyl-D-alanine ligase [Lentisphaera profundi]
MLDFNDLCQAISGEVLVKDRNFDDYTTYESDTRKDLTGAVFFAFDGDNFDGHNYLDLAVEKGSRLLIVSKEVELLAQDSVAMIKVQDTVKAWQQLGHYLLMKQRKAKRFAVTGSSGKTSTNAVLSQLLESIFPKKVLSTLGNTNNHIGVTQNIVRLKGEEECFSLELGTNHPGEIGDLAKIVKAHGAILTSVGASHIGNFTDEEAIFEEKIDIFRYMEEEGVAVVPEIFSEKVKKALSDRQDIRVISFGKSEKADVRLLNYELLMGKSLFTVELHSGEQLELETNLSGEHQLLNICACLALLELFQKQWSFKIEDLVPVIRNLDLPGMRMKTEQVGDKTFVLDCYNANPQSTAAFLKWVKELYSSGTLVLGDMLELGDKAMSYHQAIFNQAKAMKGFDLLTVGECFSKVNSEGKAFLNSDEAGEYLKANIKADETLFFKASRGIQLEKIYHKFRD